MIMIFMAVLIGLFSLEFFTLNFKIQGLNRAVICTPIELFYQDVSMTGNGAKFSTSEMTTHLDKYYEVALSRYVNDYEVTYYFYNKSDNSLCLDSYCDGVEITVNAPIDLTYTFHRVMYYELNG